MSLNLTQYPTGLCFLNKVTRFKMTADHSVTIVLTLNPTGAGEEIFAGRYHPDFNGRITVDITDIVKDYVRTAVPTDGEDYEQSDLKKEFRYKIEEDSGGSATGDFEVTNIAANTTGTLEAWCASNFLTRQAVEKRTNYESPEWLTWLDLDGDYTLKVRFYKKTGGSVEAVVRTDDGEGCYTVNVGYSRMIRLASVLPRQLKGYYDLVLCDGSDEEIASQRYLYQERSGQEHYYLMVNPQGGIDTLIADGAHVLNPEMTLNYGRFGERYESIDDAENIRKWSQSLATEWRERGWLHDLLAKRGEAAVYHASAGAYEKIVVVGFDCSMSDRGQLAGATFEYITSENKETAPGGEERSQGFTQSAADATEELLDETRQATVAFEDDGQGGMETEELEIAATKVYVEFEKTATAGTVTYSIDGKEAGSFDPSEADSPVVIAKAVDASIRFATAAALLSAVRVSYYPETVQSV